MTRILRIFALVSVVGLGIYLVGFFLFHAAALPVIGAGFGAVLGTYLLVAFVMAVAAWIGGSAASVVGVIAAVASVQRRQRGWAIALIGVVVLHYTYGLLLSLVPALARPFFPSPFIAAIDGPLLGVVMVLPIALLVLIYSFLPTPKTAEATGEVAQA